MHLTRREPDANLHRFYRLEIVPGLFGDWGLVRNWGRIGSSLTSAKIVMSSLKSDLILALGAALEREYDTLVLAYWLDLCTEYDPSLNSSSS